MFGGTRKGWGLASMTFSTSKDSIGPIRLTSCRIFASVHSP
ncbi:hypothetical protein PMI02_01625 [Novosphingobium sp. AP12]|nr:hypothetical protein PMI02_01625 [Novosphingobium sp. AP12]